MVFEKIGDNEDYLDVQNFRENAKYIFDANLITVKIIRHNSKKSEYIQGDFLGIKTPTFEDVSEFIKLNVMSINPENKIMSEEGYDGRGEIVYNCYTDYDTEICNEDVIEFIDNYGYNIKSGQQFKVNMEDQGMYQGQYCFKNLTITKI